ncbi:lysoplasmalogenase family protein [Georgenia deserti]|uniref:Lysoplasmalogenase family protein n=1 Tax=Georgenia deserti TaxID=2093781 RepID=A0ABW4L0I5_9MICO
MSGPRSAWTRPVWHVFAVLAAVHLAAQLADRSALADLTQVLLMPALALAVVTSGVRGRIVRDVLLALALSWLGDSLPKLLAGDVAFVVMLGCFLLALSAYSAAFYPLWRAAPPAGLSRFWPIAIYAEVAVVIIGLCVLAGGILVLPAAVYAVVLCVTAVLATGLGVYGTVGGALFVVSDGLIGVRDLAGVTIPLDGFLVMSTYIAAQALLVAGALRAARRGEPIISEPGR